MSWSGWIRIIYLAFLIVLPIFTNASERKPKASDIIGRFGSKLDELRRDCLGVNHIQVCYTKSTRLPYIEYHIGYSDFSISSTGIIPATDFVRDPIG
jgi:hypothetical protein